MMQYIVGRQVEDETTNADEESYKRNIVCYSVPERSNIGYVDIMYLILSYVVLCYIFYWIAQTDFSFIHGLFTYIYCSG